MSDFSLSGMMDDVLEDYQEAMDAAMSRAEEKIQEEIAKIIKTYMVKYYYGGYTPKAYVRTWQLKKAVGPFTEVDQIGGTYGLSFGVEDEEAPYGAGKMHHDVLTVKITYKQKKNRQDCDEKVFL